MSFNCFLVKWLILSCTDLNVELTVFFILFSRAVASLPKYGSLKCTGHLFGPCLIGFKFRDRIFNYFSDDNKIPRAPKILLILSNSSLNNFLEQILIKTLIRLWNKIFDYTNYTKLSIKNLLLAVNLTKSV